MTRSAFAVAGLVVGVVLAAMLTGCDGGKGGYNVSGSITFKGQPIPAGKIYFQPDSGEGNSGATGYADIKDGQYNTATSGGRGTVGGPMLIRIDGFDPNAVPANASGEETGTSLFPTYQTHATLPKSTTTQDFDVPAEAANRKDQPENRRNVGP